MGEAKWFASVRDIDGVLLDITGVLYESQPGGGQPIPGSVEAVQRLRDAGIPLRFCTNETQCTRERLVKKLRGAGFELHESEVFPPIPAMCNILKERGLRPHLLVHPESKPDFSSVEKDNPNCVVIGDGAEAFTYENLNKAFQVLIGLENPVLFTLGKGRYYQDGGALCLDVGAYARALEYACDIEAEVVGKPSSMFYKAVLSDLGLHPNKVLMVGDDIVSDVGGAQTTGMMGILVRTGKYRPQDENHATVRPDGIVDNLAQAVDLLLKHR